MSNSIKINEQFIIDLQGKSFVTYEGLLDYAHQNGLKSIEVQVIQMPNNENGMTAVCQATARTEDSVYTDIGDASPVSVTRTLVPHLIRMASTRAKARALRDLTNIGMTAYEELYLNENGNTQPIKSNIKSVAELEPPTERQLEKLKELSEKLSYEIDYRDLNKDSAFKLISELIKMDNK